MHPDVEKLVEAGNITPEVGEKLSAIAPGTYRVHKSYGSGVVSAWDLSTGKVTINFEEVQGKEMGIKLALDKTEALESTDMRAHKVSQMDELKDLADNNPVELVIRTLESHGGKMTLDQLDAELSGSVIPAKVYKKWWEKTKKALRESKRASVPTKRSDPLLLRDASASPGEHLVGVFEEARNPKAKVKALEAIQREAPLVAADKELIAKAYEFVNESARQLLKLAPAQALELVALRDDIADETETQDLISDNALRITDVLQVNPSSLAEDLASLAAARLKRILEAFPGAFGDSWVEQTLKVFDQISSRGVSEIAKLMTEKEQMDPFLEHVKVGVSRHSLGPDALAWICRERKKAAEPVFGREVGSVILTVLELDTMDDGPRKAGRLATLLAEDKELISDLLDGVAINEVRLFARKLLASPAFPELDRKSLMARVIKKYPQTQDMVSGEAVGKAEEALIVSYESLERRKAEYDDLVNKRIPQNIKEISIARDHGDLRENFEYKAARQMQSVLNRRKIDLGRDLERARATDFSGADPSSVNIGTKVTLKDESGVSKIYSIMGAWDGDPEKNLVSYLSHMGQSLVGKVVGDKAIIRDMETEIEGEVTVEKIQTL